LAKHGTRNNFFFTFALTTSNPRFAIGAVSVSTIVVSTVALGCVLWIGTTTRKSGSFQLQKPVKTQCLFLACSVIITLAIACVGFNYYIGVTGILYYTAFIIYSLTNKDEHIINTEEKREEDVELGDIEEEGQGEVPVWKGVLFLTIGGVLIFTFSGIFIDSVVTVAGYLRVNPILLAFFLAPIASEMPEILESISLSRKGNSQNINIAFSNLVGGTVAKTTLLCGIFSIYGKYKEFAWESPSYTLSLFLLAICALCASSIGAFFSKQRSWHGICLFVLFTICGFIEYIMNSSVDVEENIVDPHVF